MFEAAFSPRQLNPASWFRPVCPALARGVYGSVTIPLQNCCTLPTSTSYLRAKVSVPSTAMRNTIIPAGKLAPSRSGNGMMLATTKKDGRSDRCGKCVAERRGRRYAGSLSARRCSDRSRTRQRCFHPRGELPNAIANGWKCPVRQIHEPAPRMDVYRSGALAGRRFGIRQRFLDEEGLALKAGRVVEGVDVKLVLPFDREECPGSARMKVEMARAETKTVAGRDRSQVSQDAVIERECLDRAGILGLVRGGIVTARDQRDAAVGRRRENLARVDAGIEIWILRNPGADRAVGVQPMDGQAARIVVGGQQISAMRIDADMDGARPLRSGIALGCRLPDRRRGLSPATPGPPLLETA